MDNSEQYIKMCEKAEEIQALAKPTVNPISLLVLDNGVMLDSTGNYWVDFFKTMARPDGILAGWLPRQDQLQEMIPSINYDNDLAHLAWMFDKFCNKQRPNPFHPEWEANYLILSTLTSMEQLWLAFCMSEKFNKIWDGEKWKNKDE